jgi:hypothetical protein
VGSVVEMSLRMMLAGWWDCFLPDISKVHRLLYRPASPTIFEFTKYEFVYMQTYTA